MSAVIQQVGSSITRAVCQPSGNGGVGWEPTALPNLEIWLATDIDTLYQDAAKLTPVTADGDAVGCWADKSGNGNDFDNNYSDTYRPIYKTDYLRTDASGIQAMHLSYVSPAEFMWGVSFIPREMVANHGVLQTGTAERSINSSPFFALNSTTTHMQIYFDGGWRFTRATSTNDEVTYVFRVTQPGGGGTDFLADCWIDGVKQSQYNGGTDITASELWLSLWMSYNAYGRYDIPAFVMAHGSQSDEDAENLAAYLAIS